MHFESKISTINHLVARYDDSYKLLNLLELRIKKRQLKKAVDSKSEYRS